MKKQQKAGQKEPVEPISRPFPPLKSDPSLRDALVARMRAGEWSDGMDELWDESQRRHMQRESEARQEKDEKRE